MSAWILGLIIFAAFFVEAALGFGATLLALALGVWVCPLQELLPLVVSLNLLLSLFLVWRDRSFIDPRLLWGRYLPLMSLGLPIGLVMLSVLQPERLLTCFGVCLAAMAAWELGRSWIARSVPRPPLGSLWGGLLLLLGGVCHGLFASGGPLAVYVAGRQLHNKSAFRGTLAALWLLLNLLWLMGYALSGPLSPELPSKALGLFFPLLAGSLLGDRAHHRLNPKLFRTLVFGLLLLIGCQLAIGQGS